MLGRVGVNKSLIAQPNTRSWYTCATCLDEQSALCTMKKRLRPYAYLFLVALSLVSSYDHILQTLKQRSIEARSGRITPAHELTFVFSHIPKAAGTAFEDYLASNAELKVCPGRRNYYRYGPALVRLLSNTTKERGCNILTSETNIYSIRHHTPNRQDVRIMIFFRHPISLRLSRIEATYRDRASKNASYSIQEHESSMIASRKHQDSIYAHWLAGKSLGKRLVGDVPSWDDITRALDSMWFIGIVEAFHTSTCLLEYQMSTNMENHRQRCSCKRNLEGDSISNRFPGKFRLTQRQFVSLVSHNSRLDDIIYARAFQIFLNRTAGAESVLGYKILCDGREQLTANSLDNIGVS